MVKPKVKTIKWVLLLVLIAILGIFSVWLIINRDSVWQNITFDKDKNIATYEQRKSQEEQKDSDADRLEIPALNVIAELYYPGNTWDLNRGFGNGVGHMPQTAIPGETGNAVFFGHSSGTGSSYYETIFSTLHRLETGDLIYIDTKNAIYEYNVEYKKIVGSNDYSILTQGENKQLTLVTCWPIGTDWQRYVIVALQKE